jgi:hypothetical protein
MRGITTTTTIPLLVILVGIAFVKGKKGLDMARGKLFARLDDPGNRRRRRPASRSSS